MMKLNDRRLTFVQAGLVLNKSCQHQFSTIPRRHLTESPTRTVKYMRSKIICNARPRGTNTIIQNAMQVYSSYKPWWCQPWSILLTGLLMIVGSILLFEGPFEPLIVGGVSIAVFTWWYIFLVFYPKDVMEKMKQGSDDFF